jgi:two-component system, OmpR family, sensor histidine kinase QseC
MKQHIPHFLRLLAHPFIALIQASLVRRVVFALILAFVVAYVVLTMVQFRELTNSTRIDKQLHSLNQSLLLSLVDVNDENVARASVQAPSNLFNFFLRVEDYPFSFLFELRDHQGKRIYLSPEAGDGFHVQIARKETINTTVGGVTYRVFRDDTERWSVILAIPISDSAWTIRTIAKDILLYVCIGFVLVLVPLWITVSKGLSPLKRLSKRIAEKHADDLSPLNIDVIHAELKPMVNAMDALLAQLRAKIEREHGFVQDAAHELRTPMAVISAQAHALAMAKTNGEREDAERRMDLSIARASHLIEQLLELARIDHQARKEHPLIDVAELTRRVLADLAPSAMARDIELSLDAPESLSLAIDAQAWLSIVTNLVTNAIRYNHPHGRVDIRLSKSDTSLTLRVTDNGPGIAPEHRELVFERFYREQSHSMSGSGLGLPIVKQALSGLGGTVHLRDGDNATGCCVVVEIALYR